MYSSVLLINRGCAGIFGARHFQSLVGQGGGRAETSFLAPASSLFRVPCSLASLLLTRMSTRLCTLGADSQFEHQWQGYLGGWRLVVWFEGRPCAARCPLAILFASVLLLFAV